MTSKECRVALDGVNDIDRELVALQRLLRAFEWDPSELSDARGELFNLRERLVRALGHAIAKEEGL